MANKSGMNFHFTVWMDDGQKLDIQTKPFDVIRWEEKFDKYFGQARGSAQALMWIAYTAASRLKLTTESTFNAWAAKVTDWDVDSEDEDQDEDPTPAATPTEPSEI